MISDVQARLAIEVDPLTREIRVGAWCADRLYYNFPVRENAYFLKDDVLSANQITLQQKPTTARGHADVSQEVASYLGSRFYAQLRKVFADTWINPHRELLTRFATISQTSGRARFIPGQVVRVFDVVEGVAWLQRYGWERMTPLILYFGVHPQLLKKRLGKALWQTLCAQAPTRIKSLAAMLCALDECDHIHLFSLYPQMRKIFGERVGELPEEAFAMRVMLLQSWLSLKSVMLKYRLYAIYMDLKRHLDECLMYDGLDPDEELDDDAEDLNRMRDVPSNTYITQLYQRWRESLREVAWLDKYGTPSHRKQFGECVDLLNDTRSMSVRMGRRFELCNLRQMKIRHQMLITMIKRKAFEDRLKREQLYETPFNGIEAYINAVAAVSTPGVSVSVLSCAKALLEETTEQSHCVYDKLSYCQNMQMIVLSLRSEHQRTTLGFRLDKRSGRESVTLYQHYGAGNVDVTCEHIKSAEPVLHQLIEAVFREHHTKAT